MRSIYLGLLAGVLSLSAQAGKPGGGGSGCTDVPVTFTIVSTNPGLSPDTLGSSYTNGADGVTALLNCNGDSLELSVAQSVTRSLNLYLGSSIDGNNSPLQNPVLISFFNIPLGYAFSDPSLYPIRTYMKMKVKSVDYYFWMQTPNPSNLGLQSPAFGVNTNCNTSPVEVSYDGTTWTIYPVAVPCGNTGSYFLGTLLGPPPHGNTPVPVGQFNAPFYITVTRQ